MTSSRRARVIHRLALAAILVAGAGLRLYRLDHQSLWNDEALSLRLAGAPVGTMFASFREPAVGQVDLNPPIYSLVLRGWLAVIGFGGAQARLLSAAAGVVSLLLAYLVGRSLYEERTGLYAALLLAVSQLGVMYSQEARGYELLLVWTLASAYCFRQAQLRRSLLAWCGATLFALLAAGTHYHGMLVIVALAIYVAVGWRSIPHPWIAGAAGAVLAALVPWLGFAMSRQWPRAAPAVLPSYYSATAWTLVSTINRFDNGALAGLLDPAPHWTYAAGGILFGVPMFVALWHARRRQTDPDRGERSATVLAGLLFGVPIISALAATALFNVQFDTRYVAFCIAPYYVLVAAGLGRMPAAARTTLVVLIVVYSACALRANYVVPYKENYRDAIALVASQSAPDDCYAFAPFGTPPLAWPIYTATVASKLLSPAGALPSTTECPRIWILTYQRVPIAAQAGWDEWLASATAPYRSQLVRQFFWYRVELYAPRAPG